MITRAATGVPLNLDPRKKQDQKKRTFSLQDSPFNRDLCIRESVCVTAISCSVHLGANEKNHLTPADKWVPEIANTSKSVRPLTLMTVTLYFPLISARQNLYLFLLHMMYILRINCCVKKWLTEHFRNDAIKKFPEAYNCFLYKFIFVICTDSATNNLKYEKWPRIIFNLTIYNEYWLW